MAEIVDVGGGIGVRVDVARAGPSPYWGGTVFRGGLEVGRFDVGPHWAIVITPAALGRELAAMAAAIDPEGAKLLEDPARLVLIAAEARARIGADAMTLAELVAVNVRMERARRQPPEVLSAAALEVLALIVKHGGYMPRHELAAAYPGNPITGFYVIESAIGALERTQRIRTREDADGRAMHYARRQPRR